MALTQGSRESRRRAAAAEQIHTFLRAGLIKLAAWSLPGMAIVIAVRSYRAEAAGFFGQRHAVPAPDELRRLSGFETVTFPSRDGATIRGWYLPSQNRAAIVLSHGAVADRRSVVVEALALHGKGFGTLLFDWPGHGESEGEIHFSAGERAALVGALDFLDARQDVDPEKIGAFGFSMGAYVLAQVAAADARLKATVLAGAPPDARDHIRWEYRKWGLLAQLPALLALSRCGLPVSELRPRDTVRHISPRPVLVVGGENDPLVPMFMTRQLFAEAREPKELLVVSGAEHGSYAEAAPDQYPAALVSFFERVLLPDPSQ